MLDLIAFLFSFMLISKTNRPKPEVVCTKFTNLCLLICKARLIFAIFAFFLTGALARAVLDEIFGPVVRTCWDGWVSPSIGTQGACSHHGGVKPDPRAGWLFLVGMLSSLATFFFLKSLDSKLTDPQDLTPDWRKYKGQLTSRIKPRKPEISEAERKRRRYFALKKKRSKNKPFQR